MFNFLTRSGRVSYDNVRVRDGALRRRLRPLVRQDGATAPDASVLLAPPPLFTPAARAGTASLRGRAVLALGPDLGAEDGVPGEAHRAALVTAPSAAPRSCSPTSSPWRPKGG